MDDRHFLRAALQVADAIVCRDPSWPRQLLDVLAQGIGADTVGYASWPRGQFHESRSENIGGPPLSEWERATWPSYLTAYPFFKNLFANGRMEAARTSDYVSSMREFWSTEVYSNMLSPRDARYQTNFAILDDTEIAIVGLYRAAHDFSVDEIVTLERARKPLAAALRYTLTVTELQHALGAQLPTIANDLTPREQDVLALVATGATNRQIAGRLAITERTVRKHIQDIHVRLHVTNRVAAARWWESATRRATM